MRTKFKAWTKPYLDEHQEVQLTLQEVNALEKEVYLEIGSGKGQFLLDMAKNNPSLMFVGIEKNVTCAGFCAKKLVENEITNAKIIFNDAVMVLDSFKSKSINTIFLNFSDPWPKKRHHKRRLTADSFLDRYFSILKDDGKIIFKTDNVELFDDTKEVIETSKFKAISIDENYDGKDSFDAQTEYEISFRNEGVPIHRMILVKR